MSSINFKIPFQISNSDSFFSMNSTHEDAIKDNIKFLLNMNKGDNLMHPNMGVGLKNLIFNNYKNVEQLTEIISTSVSEELNKWIPYVKLGDMKVDIEDSTSGGMYIKLKMNFDISTNKYIKILIEETVNLQ